MIRECLKLKAIKIKSSQIFNKKFCVGICLTNYCHSIPCTTQHVLLLGKYFNYSRKRNAFRLLFSFEIKHIILQFGVIQTTVNNELL